MTVALEYEKTAKTNWRYNKAISAYSYSGDYQMILFIVEKPSIEAVIRRSMGFVANGKLNSKIGFISAEDWKNNPMTAEIRTAYKAKMLRKIIEEI